MDDEGNVVTEQVKDGTKTYFDLWPEVEVGAFNASDDVNAFYQELLVNSEKELTDTDVSGLEDGRSPDGVLKIQTTFDQDQQTKNDLEKFKLENPKFNGRKCNCSNFAQKGIESATGKKIDATERIMVSKSTTPNRLYQEVSKMENVKVVKDPKDKVNKSFIKGSSGF